MLCSFITLFFANSDENSINLGASGVIPVAILRSDTFDAAQEINPETLSLAGAAVKSPRISNKILCSFDDVDGDNLIDLICHFENDLGIEMGDTTAILEGETFGCIPIRGQDTISIVP